jgi:arylformamidase
MLGGYTVRLYDISEEVFSSAVYPGDPTPERRVLSSTAAGDLYNLTAFSMCAHNGTHIDAPFHFLGDGKTVEQIPLTKTVGPAVVVDCRGDLDADGAEELLTRARAR